eukprot:COSAG03_NODE_16902_length_389_cov_0.696552_2_plen_100_part_01
MAGSIAGGLIRCTGGMVHKAENEDDPGGGEREPLLRSGAQDGKYAPINDAGQAARSAASAKSRAIFIRGLLLAILVGMCGGSTLVPIKFSPVRSATLLVL